MPASSSAYAEAGHFTGGSFDGMRHGRGRFAYANRYFVYDGGWREGEAHGEGVLQMADGGTYEGSFVDGEMSGTGVRRWADGGMYAGEFVCGELHGVGKYEAPTLPTPPVKAPTISSMASHQLVSFAPPPPPPEQYEGEYRHNQRHGRGALRTARGDRYEGEFLRHRIAGAGTMEYASGDVYAGEFRRGERCGRGTMRWAADGATLEGEWEAGEPLGACAYQSPGGGLRRARDGTQRGSTRWHTARRPSALPPPPNPWRSAQGAALALSSAHAPRRARLQATASATSSPPARCTLPTCSR